MVTTPECPKDCALNELKRVFGAQLARAMGFELREEPDRHSFTMLCPHGRAYEVGIGRLVPPKGGQR